MKNEENNNELNLEQNDNTDNIEQNDEQLQHETEDQIKNDSKSNRLKTKIVRRIRQPTQRYQPGDYMTQENQNLI